MANRLLLTMLHTRWSFVSLASMLLSQNGTLFLCHHSRVVKESGIELITEETLTLVVEQDVPDGEHHNLHHLHDDEPLEPVAFLLEHKSLVDAVLARLRGHDHGLQEGHNDVEAAENPLHHSVHCLKCLRSLRDKAMLVHLDMVALPDVKFEEGSVHKIGHARIEPKLEGKLEPLGNVHPRVCKAGYVWCERLHRVEGEQESVEQQTGDVVKSLIQQESPEDRSAVILVVIGLGAAARVVRPT